MASDQLSKSEAALRRFQIESLLTFCAAAIPVVFLIFLVLRYAVSIPMLDDWEMVDIVTKAHNGGLTFVDLFAQQEEARTFFPRLVFILCAFGKYWDGRIEMMLSILICCLTSLGIYLLLGKSGLTKAARTALFLLMVLLIFSPVQHELWLLASGFPSFIPALCVVWGIFVTQTRFSIATKFWICLALAVFSSFTLAHGLLAWGLTFPLVFATQPVPGRKRWLGFWLLACVGCAAIYFWHFHPPPDLPPFAPRKSLFDYVQYVSAFLGSGLARTGTDRPLVLSIVAGLVLLLGYIAALGYSIFHWRDRAYRARVLPWITLGAYSVGSGCLAALGRIEWGVTQALESRYVAFSLYLTVAMIALVAIFITEFSKNQRGARVRPAVFAATIFLCGIYLTLELWCAVASVPLFRLRSAAARLGHGAVLFSQVVDTSETIRKMNYPRATFVRQNADTLDRLHLLRTPLVRTTEVNKLRHTDASAEGVAGWFDGLSVSDKGVATAVGWAVVPGKGRPADCVVLAYESERDEWNIFALSNAVLKRSDVAASLRSADHLWSGWSVVFPRDAVPKGAKISAWAVDAKDAKLYQLK